MVKVKIINMMFYGFHGYYEYEREQGQKFFFDVELMMEDDKATNTDNLNDGVDTARVYDIVRDVTENQRFQLLAALGGHIAERLLQRFPHIDRAAVRVRKPSVPIAGPIDYVEVEVIRDQVRN